MRSHRRARSPVPVLRTIADPSALSISQEPSLFLHHKMLPSSTREKEWPCSARSVFLQVLDTTRHRQRDLARRTDSHSFADHGRRAQHVPLLSTRFNNSSLHLWASYLLPTNLRRPLSRSSRRSSHGPEREQSRRRGSTRRHVESRRR